MTPDESTDQKERTVKPSEISLLAALGILLGTFVLVLTVGLVVGYQFYWNKFDQTPRLDAEVAKWSGLLAQEPDNFEAAYQLGWSYFQKGDLDEALEYSRKAAELRPEHAGALYNIGITYFALQQFEPASLAFKQLADQYPRHELAWYGLGRSYLELGRTEEARTTLEHTQVINPTSSDVTYTLGQAYERLGEREKAIEAYQTALRFDPMYKSASEALEKLGVTNL